MSGTLSDPSSSGQTVTSTAMAGAGSEPGSTVPAHIGTGLGVWVRDLIISLAISAFIIIFLYQPVKVEGTSMMPSLDDQERIFVNKFVYRLESIQRGDIVVFGYWPMDKMGRVH